jgi:hypothetical protein
MGISKSAAGIVGLPHGALLGQEELRCLLPSQEPLAGLLHRTLIGEVEVLSSIRGSCSKFRDDCAACDGDERLAYAEVSRAGQDRTGRMRRTSHCS